ncbi:hypothetical protein B296_00036223 [Ensete ventricosum]|uniref:Hexosyltransferase n=1 Tax=Ensete ventricosum TaxID=4639 RepID=A0A426X5N5_ENSVE|nr:hypothetical protein B296_00036223 [Ensete ventricosum]
MVVRKLVLFLLSITVLLPIVLYTDPLATQPSSFGNASKSVFFWQQISISATRSQLWLVTLFLGYWFFSLSLGSMLKSADAVREPTGIVYPENSSNPDQISDHDGGRAPGKRSKGDSGSTPDAKIQQFRDQLMKAKVYLGLSSSKSNPEFIRELKERVKDVERTLAYATEDTELPFNAREKLEAMEQTLAKGKQIQQDCCAVVKKLRGFYLSAEEQARVHKKRELFLTQVAAKTLPRGLHCLSLRLTADYHSLDSSQQQLPNRDNLENPRLYHYALFSDNVLATAVVVNSTVFHAKDPERHVFHIVTDRLNYAAMKMWFLANPPGRATVQVQKVEEFTWLNSSYSPVLKQLASRSMRDYYFRSQHAKSDENLKYRNPKYLSIMNHLRFYLPEIFPKLSKVVFLDDDVVVQRDLTPLWVIDLEGKVNGAVETCGESFHRFDRTYPLERSWHVLGLGYSPKVEHKDVEAAAVIHYNGNLKPWLEIGMTKYRNFWSNHVDYNQAYLRDCNINP